MIAHEILERLKWSKMSNPYCYITVIAIQYYKVDCVAGILFCFPHPLVLLHVSVCSGIKKVRNTSVTQKERLREFREHEIGYPGNPDRWCCGMT